jgi:large repetitive protein
MKLTRWSALVAAAVLLPLATAGLTSTPAYAVGFPTTTTIGSSANPSAACGSVTFTATVHGALFPDSPEGLVQFFDGDSLLGGPQVITPDFDPDPIFGTHTIPTNHSSASITVSLSGGSHTITAGYVLGTDVPSVGGPLFQEVTAASSSTAVASSVNPSVFGQPTVLGAFVTSPCPAATAGTVQFKVDGVLVGGPQPVSASGHAAFAVSDLAVGTHPVTADFTSSSTDVTDSSGALPGGQVVNPAATSTGVSSSANPSEFGASVTFTTTSPVPPGAGTPTGAVQFADSGAALSGPVTVGGGGQATLSTSALGVGSHSISAGYVSDGASFTNSSGSLTQVVNKARTTLTYTGDTTADYDDPAALAARLTRTDDGAPVAGKLVAFAMGAESCSQTTDANGVAACSVTPSEPAGTYPLTASFAGDGNYLGSGGGASFVVTKEETTTTYTGPTVIAQGQPVTLSGQLLEDGTKPISGRVLTLTLGSGASAQSCTTAATDAAGSASCVVASVSVGQGPQPVSATFTGDPYYLPSSDASHQVIVFAFPTRGIFTLGDATVAAGSSPVTFWGAQWAASNALSDGAAPSSFKGFADNPGGTPPACGAAWTSAPGNSSSPVSTLPAYMGTAVTSSVTKHGSSIGGTVTKIVVVVTAPGYAANPGHAGTGTVVATYCQS